MKKGRLMAVVAAGPVGLKPQPLVESGEGRVEIYGEWIA
jgi:hypothetical protein